MYNLFMGYIGPDETEDEITVGASRFLEYTDSETQMRYATLTSDAVHEIKGYPCLFMHEHCKGGAFVGSITHIADSDRDYRVIFKRNEDIGIISAEDIKRIALELGIEKFEFYRTHWAIKNSDLLRVFGENKISKPSEKESTEDIPENKPAEEGSTFNKDQVFIVHGHDEHAKNDVKAYVESKGLEPIILHLQASGGRTIIEKIDHYSNVGFGVVLYTECDVGAKRDTLSYKWRARQNVVFEHGYLIAKLSRSRVAALVKGSVETPNDISGVVYITMDAAGNWRNKLDTELKNAGYEIKDS
uniref:Predicted nucleotide-binding protein containing TIR-like domain-containing protein n=1 Tax=Candidatus Kentrum sp. TC TaxID=2126339 RepID=A0A450Z048_9GAMM|nr:MAG: Predicted nucleotide-binding protein containing TIR-like domain-containing protein [Candidatus Kentron sp. TC]